MTREKALESALKAILENVEEDCGAPDCPDCGPWRPARSALAIPPDNHLEGDAAEIVRDLRRQMALPKYLRDDQIFERATTFIECRAVETTERGYYLTVVEMASLRMAVETFDKAFPDAIGVYHVGSSLSTKDYRDIDIRLILRDDHFERLFGPDDKSTGHVDFWLLTCLAYSEWLQKRTGLPVDFQIQSMSGAQEYKGKPRNAMLLSYPGDNQ